MRFFASYLARPKDRRVINFGHLSAEEVFDLEATEPKAVLARYRASSMDQRKRFTAASSGLRHLQPLAPKQVDPPYASKDTSLVNHYGITICVADIAPMGIYIAHDSKCIEYFAPPSSPPSARQLRKRQSVMPKASPSGMQPLKIGVFWDASRGVHACLATPTGFAGKPLSSPPSRRSLTMCRK